MTEIASKSALLEQIEREREFWDGLVAEVGEERMLQPGATGDWSFKDVVVHLNGWRAKTLARLEAARQGKTPAAPPWPANLSEDNDDDIDEINNWIQQAGRDRSLQQVLDEYQRSFQQFHDAVTALSERDLFEPGRYSWLKDYPLAAVITDSFGHLHEEHEPVLRAWLGRGKQAGA